MSDIGALLGLGFEALKNNFSQLGRPYKLNFAVTMWCQSRCLTCNIWKLRPKDELKLEEIEEFSRKNRHFRWIGLTGGEPFMRSDIVEVAGAFKHNSNGLYMLTIPTNSLCNQDKEVEKIRQMLELKIPRIVITVSLDGNREMHDKVRGVPGNFDKAVSMFKRLREMRREYPALNVVFGYTISKINEGSLERTYKDLKMDVPDLRYNDFHLNLAQLSDNYYHNGETSIAADRNIAVKEILNAKANMKHDMGMMNIVESEFVDGLAKFASTGNAPMKCRSLDASLFMDSFGNVYPSIMWNYKIGNVRESGYDLEPIWRSEAANDARAKIANGLDPMHWTSCEAYQSILGNILARRRIRGAASHNANAKEEVEVNPIKT